MNTTPKNINPVAVTSNQSELDEIQKIQNTFKGSNSWIESGKVGESSTLTALSLVSDTHTVDHKYSSGGSDGLYSYQTYMWYIWIYVDSNIHKINLNKEIK